MFDVDAFLELDPKEKRVALRELLYEARLRRLECSLAGFLTGAAWSMFCMWLNTGGGA